MEWRRGAPGIGKGFDKIERAGKRLGGWEMFGLEGGKFGKVFFGCNGELGP